MFANSVWGLAAASLACVLAALGVSDPATWFWLLTGAVVFALLSAFILVSPFLRRRLGMGPEHLIMTGSAGALLFGGVALAGAIWKSYQPPPATEQAPLPIRTGVKLQFFGDQRIPTEITQNNVASWFAYFSRSLTITPQDAEGHPIAGGMQIPPNWAIFISFDRPATYRQVIVDFSNPSAMPVIDRQFQNSRVLVISTRGMLPAGVLDIHTQP